MIFDNFLALLDIGIAEPVGQAGVQPNSLCQYTLTR